MSRETFSMRTGAHGAEYVAALAAVVLFQASVAVAGVAFGPREYVRGTGEPVAQAETVRPCRPGGFRLVVQNGPGARPRVSSATLTLDGVEVVHERDLSQRVERVERDVTLRAESLLAVRLAGAPGGVVAVSLVGAACPEIALTTPAPGTRVPSGRLLVRGTVRGAPGIGVSVNGAPALVDGEGFAGLVDVDVEDTELIAIATAPDGTTAQARLPLIVEPAPESEVRLYAHPAGGRAPLTVGFFLSTIVGADRLALDSLGSPARFEGEKLDGVEFTYAQPGIYAPRVEVEADGKRYVATTLVHVYDQLGLDARLQAVWTGVKDALRSGDLATAAAFVHSDTRAAYERMWRGLAPVLPGIDRYMTTIRLVELGFGGAQYEMLRQDDGETLSFAVWFQVDHDGVWRLRRY